MKKCILPVWVFFGIVTAKAQVKVLTHVTVYPTAHNKALAVVTGIFHVHHLMVILMTFRFSTT